MLLYCLLIVDIDNLLEYMFPTEGNDFVFVSYIYIYWI